MLAGTHPKNIVDSVSIMFNKKMDSDNPFGDGQASIRILKILEEKL
jgi:UDP-N-acetylglucosamine 2-epimerase